MDGGISEEGGWVGPDILQPPVLLQLVFLDGMCHYLMAQEGQK